MNPEDRQLERLLRQVDVPEDLKSRLRLIADEEPIAHDATSAAVEVSDDSNQLELKKAGEVGKTWKLVAMAIAASLMGVAAYVLWPSPSNPSDAVAVEHKVEIKSDGPNSESPQNEIVEAVKNPTSESPSAVQPTARELLAELEDDANRMDQLVLQVRINELQSQIKALEDASDTITSSTGALSLDEQNSMVLSLADQSAIQLGSDREVVKRNLNFVIEKFPGTRGSKLAQEILQTEL